VCYNRLTVYAYVPKFVSIGLFCPPLAAKFFTVFCWTSAFIGVDSWRQSVTVEHGFTTTHLPLSNGIKIVSVLQCLLGEIVRTNSDVQKRGGETNKQTKNSTFLAAPVAGEIRAPPNLAR